MENVGLFQNRKMLPRWRSINNLAHFETDSTSSDTAFTRDNADALNENYKEWQNNPTLGNATEVIDAAMLADNKLLAIGPAQQILKAEYAPEMVKHIARTITDKSPISKDNILSPQLNDGLSREFYVEEIQLIKKRLKDEPRNAFLWLELARLQATSSHIKSADKAIRQALLHAPNNRIILRCCIRFYAHIHEPEEGHKWVLKAESVKTDPWVQSAEIAAATLSRKTPVSIKAGLRNILSDSFDPIHISELSASIGTEELISGNAKKAHKLFKASLISPTENSVAQAVWMETTREGFTSHLTDSHISMHGAFEAQANASINNGDYKKAIRHCTHWALDEPYSVGPYVQGSYIALSLLNNNKEGLDFALNGLIANPKDHCLLNNAIVAYARIGDITKARKNLSYLEGMTPCTMATRGLIEYRDNKPEKGRELYKSAVRIAVQNKDIELCFRAKIHWLHEEAQLGGTSPQGLEEAIEVLDNEARYHSKDIKKLSLATWEKNKKEMREETAQNSTNNGKLFITDKLREGAIAH